ncbi:phage tail tape measure protein [Clostridium botulinum]|uniref:phage tail tape measure protein n=1 Tax=Clostridium botulinum TaxID=1491 RepID=UPI0009474654|nr:phage tail tape measure protein [Clostridium botulinum]APQ73361.1 phage tail tape measure protein, TP901 family, core region [Clostridium botulinum]AUN22131.1 phage tail tape measure protein [Clostridium botulinum]
MDKSVYTAVANIEKSYKLWENANKSSGKSLEDNSKKIETYKSSMKLLEDEINKSEKTLEKIGQQCGKNSKEYENYKSHVLDLKLKHSELSQELDKASKTTVTIVDKLKNLDEGYQKTSTQISNLEKSYKLLDLTQEKSGKGIFDNSEKMNKLKKEMSLLDNEIKKHEALLKEIEQEYGKDSKEVEEYKGKILDLKIAHAELGSELKKTEKEATTFAGKLKILGNEFEKIDKKYETFDKVGDTLQGIGNKLTTHVTLPIIGAGTAATKFAFDFENGAAKVSTIADTTKVPIENLKRGVIDLSNKTGMSTKELNESLYQAISGSVDTAKAVDFLDVAVKAAKGGFTETSTAVDGLTTVLNSYGLEADKATDISNQMLITQNLGKTTFGELASAVGKVTPIAASLGVTTNELFSSLASTTAQGLNTAESVTALKAAMSNIIKPSKEAGEAAEQLGIDFSVSALQSKGWMGFLQDVKKGLSNASPEFDKLSKSMSDNAHKMLELENAGKKGTKEYKELSKAQKNASKDLEIMAQAADSPIGAMATMFGSVEGLNSILMLTSENGVAKYNASMQEMQTNTTALDDAYNKMEQSTETKFVKAMNKAKNSLMELGIKALPIVEKGIDLISRFADWMNKLSPATQEFIIKTGLASAALGPFISGLGGAFKGVNTLLKTGKKVGVFFGIFKEASTVATAVEGVGTAAKVAGGSGGLGLFAGGLGTIGSIALPVTAGIIAVGGAIYVAHKNTQYLNDSCIKSAEDMGVMETAMARLNGHTVYTNKELEKMNVKHREWSKKVSPETQKALDGIANKIANYNMELNGASKLDRLADDETGRNLNAKLDDICNSAINKIKSKQPEIQKTLADSFKADGLDANEKKILDSLNKSGNNQIKKIQDTKKKILDLEKRASKETGTVRQNTLKEIEKLTQQIGNIEMKNTVKSKQELLAAQADFNARMQNLDMKGVSKLLEEKAKLRDKETDKIKQNYNKQIEYLKLNAQDVDAETKKIIDAKITQLEEAKNKEIGVENEKYKGFLNTALEQQPLLLQNIDVHNGKMLTKQKQHNQEELVEYVNKMEKMDGITKTGYYQIKNTVTGKMHDCYVEVDKSTGQITGVWDRTVGKVYGNPIKAQEQIAQDLKNGVPFQKIEGKYYDSKNNVWNNALEAQCKKNYGLFDWVSEAYNAIKSAIGSSPIVVGTSASKIANIGEKWTGTDYFEGGLTWVDEDGSELIQLPGKGPKLVDLPKGTKIFNNTQSNSMKERLSKKQVKNSKGYASGTDFASPGLHEVAEDGFEIVASRQYRLFNGGEKVFNNRESKKILTSLLESKSKPEDIAREAMSEAKESVSVNPRAGVSESVMKDRLVKQLNWGANSKKEYQKYLEFIDQLNKEEIEKSKEYLKEDYDNRSKSIEDRLRILKNENSIELQTEKAKIDSQIAYYQKLQKNTKDKNAKVNYANQIAALRQYQKQVLNTTKANQKAQVDSLERSKRALKEYYDDGMKLLDKREKEVKKSLKVQENVFNNTINEYNEAIKRLGIDTKDLNKNLLNYQAIVILQGQKIEVLKNRYEELAKTFGYTAEETVKAKKALEEAKTELINMGNTVEDTKQKIIDAQKEADKKVSDSINNMVDRIKSALKQRYEDELKAQEDHINNELKNLDRWKDESIKRIESFYDSKIEAIDKQLVEEDKADKNAEELKKINQLETALEYEHNEFNKIEIQKELNNLLKEREKRIHKEQLEEQKEQLQKEKENELKNINSIYESNRQSLEKQLDDYRSFCAKKTNDAALQAEAERIIMDNNQKEIIELLHSYEEAYQQAGQSLGEKLVEGFKPKIEELKDMIASIQESFEVARNSALNSMATRSSAINSIQQYSSNASSTSIDNSRSVVNHNSFTFNSPRALSPSEMMRKNEVMIRNLNFSTS